MAGKLDELTEQEKAQFPNLAFWTMTKQAFKFNPNHVFVDTNVLVGGYSGAWIIHCTASRCYAKPHKTKQNTIWLIIKSSKTYINFDYSYSFQQRILRIKRIKQIIMDFTDFFQIRW